ncbi:hypothetical protein IP78_05570 [Brevundimonas sp. AAP58]|uniref:hypothetical protein n=1 Tax=Brevundimonas sp. AAP58 TaxID=1523422 RepID=UPI0006B89A15|nr:hypothetical protein [Brevundimonas sp. AAP58]KPF81118.1 hypothetical protein IP78_05570 [Brevundimonas sp. AAP58]
MTDDDAPQLDPEDALEAKLRLGVLASALLDSAQVLCTDVELLRFDVSGRILRSQATDFATLAAAMEVLERRSQPISRRE